MKFQGEFDLGFRGTLAVCLTHESRMKVYFLVVNRKFVIPENLLLGGK